MNNILIAFAILFTRLPTTVAQEVSLKIFVDGFNQDGDAYVILFEEGHGIKTDCEDCRREKGIISDKKCLFTLSGLKKGKYAVIAYHDENKNGVLDTNFIGIPKEGAGNSNNHKGKPSFGKLQFELIKDQEIRISINYF